MKGKIGYIIRIAGFCLFSMLIASCVRTENRTDRFQVPVKFKVRGATDMSSVDPFPATPVENHIAQIDVLVFENGQFGYIAYASNIDNAGSTVDFTAYFRATTAKATFWIIANARDAVDAASPQPGESQESLMPRIVSSFTAAGVVTDFGMFGSHELPDGLPPLPQTLPTIVLSRDVARVDVMVLPSVNSFRMTSIRAFRANSLIGVVPSSLDGTNPVVVPTIPAASTQSINTSPLTVTNNISESQLYLPESATFSEEQFVSKATCVIVGGHFNDSPVETYYRLDFNPAISDYAAGQILRNYHYVFTISGVTLPGFATPEEAAKSFQTGISATVLDWNDNDTYFDFSGDGFLGVSGRSLQLPSPSGSSGNISVETNISPYTIEWADAGGTGNGQPSSTSIENGSFLAQILDNGRTIRITSLTANNTGSNIINYILLQAARFRVLLTVVQRPSSGLNVTPSSFIVSASGGVGFLLVSSTSNFMGVPNVGWLTSGTATDTLKWSASNNPSTTTGRSGVMQVSNLDGDVVNVPFTQPATDTRNLRIHSLRNGLGYLGAGAAVSTAEARAQGLKGILANAANFGLTGKVNCGGFTFSETVTLNYTISPADTTDLSVFYSPDLSAQSVISVATATALRTWLAVKPNRVMVICFDESNRNANLLNQFGVNDVVYGVSTGTFPLQFTAVTTFFTTSGPFTAYPSLAISGGFSFRNYDGTHAEIPVATHPNITPVLLGPQGGIVLGVDFAARVVFVGDVDIFNSLAGTGATTDNRITNTTGLIDNNASKLIANVWAWVAQTCLARDSNSRIVTGTTPLK